MTDLVPSLSIANFVNKRAAVVEKMLAAFRLLDEAKELAQEANLGFPAIAFDHKYPLPERPRLTGEYSKKADAERLCVLAVDTRAWDYLLNASGVRTFMDAKRRLEWKQQIDKGNVPEVNAENIAATFGTLYDNRTSMHEDGVIRCFQRLSWNYKTNVPHMFGDKIILKRLLSQSGWPELEGASELDDLMRAFHVADGVPELDHRLGMYEVLSQAFRTGQSDIETPYLRVQTYKNGNGHVRFKRPDLVKRLNGIIARHFPGALPSPKR